MQRGVTCCTVFDKLESLLLRFAVTGLDKVV